MYMTSQTSALPMESQIASNFPPNEDEQTVFTVLNITNQFDQQNKRNSERAGRFELHSTNMFRNMMMFHRERSMQGDQSTVPLYVDINVDNYLFKYDSKKLSNVSNYADAISEPPTANRPSYGQSNVSNNWSDETNYNQNNIEFSNSDYEMLQIDQLEQQQRQQMQFDGENEYLNSNETDNFLSNINQSNNNNNYQRYDDDGGDQFAFDNQQQQLNYQNEERIDDADGYNSDNSVEWLYSDSESDEETDSNEDMEISNNEEQSAFATFEENLNYGQVDVEMSELNNMNSCDLEIEQSNASLEVSSNSLISNAIQMNVSADPDNSTTNNSEALINDESNAMRQQQELPSGSLQQSFYNVESNISDNELFQINALQQQQLQFDGEHEYLDGNNEANNFLASKIGQSNYNCQIFNYGREQFAFDNQQLKNNLQWEGIGDDDHTSDSSFEWLDSDSESEEEADSNNVIESNAGQNVTFEENFNNVDVDEPSKLNNNTHELEIVEQANATLEELSNSDHNLQNQMNISADDSATNSMQPINGESIVMGQQQELPSGSLLEPIDGQLSDCETESDDESWIDNRCEKNENEDSELSDEMEEEQDVVDYRKVQKGFMIMAKTIGFNCPECSRFFADKNKLNGHLLSVHYKSPFICQAFGCKKRFDQSMRLKSHCRLHDKKTEWICTAQNCEYSTVHRNCFSVHFYALHVKGRFQCRICSNEYSFRNEAKNHFVRDHTNLKLFNTLSVDVSSSDFAN